MRNLILILIIFSIPCLGSADDLYKQKQNSEALEKTQTLLRDPSQREAAVKSDPKAMEIDAKAGALAGTPENKQKMYEISADVMEKLTNETGGDVDKMNKILEAAQKDPKGFYDKMFDSKSKAAVEKVSSDIEKNQKPSLQP